MKKRIILILFFVITYISYGYSQTIPKADSLGLPGDNLNLYAVLDLFQKSETFEVFEKKLNAEDSKINNLDLNNDGKIDYIKVIDHQNGDAHSIVLQVPINEKENQDVAVIEIEKDKSGKTVVQIVGNEDLYGKNYIVEPQENDPSSKTAATKNPNTKSDTTVSKDGKTVIINNTTNNYNTTNSSNNGGYGSERAYVSVDYWPMVRYMYAPGYVMYSSPWYWYSYPMWWHPWTPWFWHDYYWHHYNYYNHYHGCYHRTEAFRNSNANNYYGPRRSSSMLVQNNRTSGVYVRTYTSMNNNRSENRPATSNPVYKGQPSNNNTRENNSSQSNGRQNKSDNNNSKPNYNRPSNNSSQAPRQSRSSSAPRSNGGGGGRSSGGGGGRSSGGGGHGGGRHK